MDVDIWSDIACPWCYMGKRRLEAALESFEHRDEVVVRFHSFELDPQAPAQRDGDTATMLAEKRGTSREEALAMLAQVTGVAAGDGLALDLEHARGGNTFDAHRLLHLALAHDLQAEVKERLMRAYFVDGELVSDHATLRRLALEVGLPEPDVDELLAGDLYAEEVRTDEITAAALRITGVPFFVVDRSLAVAGAQSPDCLLEMLRRGWAAREPAGAVSAGGQSRGVEPI
jgi:predicted DsbA family dithiol-disulfide isomerase